LIIILILTGISLYSFSYYLISPPSISSLFSLGPLQSALPVFNTPRSVFQAAEACSLSALMLQFVLQPTPPPILDNEDKLPFLAGKSSYVAYWSPLSRIVLA
jgi:hypothetical protein